jgi:hypothetical protein
MRVGPSSTGLIESRWLVTIAFQNINYYYAWNPLRPPSKPLRREQTIWVPDTIEVFASLPSMSQDIARILPDRLLAS